MNIIHPLQSHEWAEFRKKTGVKVILSDSFVLTIHKIPHTPFTIGYLPKGKEPSKKLIDQLKELGQKQNCIFIQLEPNVQKISSANLADQISNLGLKPATHPLFTRYTFQLDLRKSEEDLLKNMHPKTRYNIKVAQKHGVKIVEDNSDSAFDIYLKLLRETTKRQQFYAHDKKYHKLMWQTFAPAGIAHLLVARYKNQILAAWILFVYDNVLYYPYGTSTDKYKEIMASNLMMWEAIKFGKKMGCRTFDMWGSLGPDPDKNDPWYGFHRFKLGYGGRLVEFIGSYDLVIRPFWYSIFTVADKLRWIFLKIKRLI